MRTPFSIVNHLFNIYSENADVATSKLERVFVLFNYGLCVLRKIVS